MSTSATNLSINLYRSTAPAPSEPDPSRFPILPTRRTDPVQPPSTPHARPSNPHRSSPPHRQCLISRGFLPGRFSDAGRKSSGAVCERPASENLHLCSHSAPRLHLLKYRGSSRSRTFIRGSITFPYSGIAVDCVVGNLSESGACLTVEYPNSIPDDFDLTIGSDDVVKLCQVVWLDSDRVGVEFR
jgi:PilZ domain-containing protein